MKKLLFGCLFAVAATTSHAAYLYWQLTGSEDVSQVNLNYNAARVGYLTSGQSVTSAQSNKQYLQAISLGGGTLGKGGASDGIFGVSLDTLDGGAGYSFFIELVNWDSSTIAGVSEVKTYDQLASLDYIDTGASLIMNPTAAWTGGSYAAPEPTSALLLLLGAAALGLKRKRI